MHRSLPAVAAMFSLAAQAQTPAISDADLAIAAQIRDRALDGTSAWDTVASLTSEVGPRFAGSPGDRAAVAWAVDKLKQLGFQNVRTQDVTVPQWVRGTLEVAITAPYPQPLTAVSLGGSIGTAQGAIAAEVVQVADIEALRARPRSEVEGRIVYIARRTARARDGGEYKAAASGRTQGASAAAKLGARAIVIRSIGTSSERFGHTGTVKYVADVPRIPAVALANPDADLLERQLALGRPTTLEIRSTARDLPPMRSANVIGELPGSGAPDEIVLLGAHLDSWDLGPGALDDAAGVAIVTEAVRLIREMQIKPRRTLRVVLFADEEFVQSGANAYAGQPVAEIERHVVAMEADLGAGPVWRFDHRVAEEALPGMGAFMRVLEPLGIRRGSSTADGGTDIAPLRRLGVPVISFQHDASRYFDYHHTANDTLDKVDREALDQTVAAYASTAFLAANAGGDFGRLPPTPAPAPANPAVPVAPR
jgi:hypothetical protein